MPLDKTVYDNFIRELEIVNVTIPSASWQLFDFPPNEITIRNEIEFHLEDTILSEDRSLVTIPAKLRLTGKGDDEGKKFYEIFLLQHMTVAINPEHSSEEILEAYIHRNALLTMVPVFREQVKYACFQMGIPPLILPALKLIASKEES